MHTRYLTLMLLSISAVMAHAQAVPAGTTPGDIQVGVTYTLANPDYSPHHANGFGFFADADLWKHLGVEAEFHRVVANNSTPAVTESTYAFGARYRYPFRRLSPYVKILGGGALFNFNNSGQNGTYGMYAGGGGLDYAATQHFILRADYEYQRWGSFPPHGLQPNLFTAGIGYRFR